MPGGILNPGQEIAIVVGQDHAGERVGVWMFSSPTSLGTHTVAANGRIGVTIPADAQLRTHRIAVYDAAGDLLGWQDVKVAAATADDDNSGDGRGSGTPSGGSGGLLPDTGADLPVILAPLGLLMLVAGGVMLVGRRRRDSV